MSSMMQTAQAFFEACETGQGWAACRAHCTPDASFSAQAEPLAKVTTLEGYTDWMKGIVAVLTDAHYDLKSFAVDEARQNVSAFATFIGTHLAGGPMPPTGRTTRTDYVYVMQFRDGRIAHMTKIWNSGYALKELGWA